MKTVAFRMAYHYFPFQAQKLCSRRGARNLCASPCRWNCGPRRRAIVFCGHKKGRACLFGQSSVISRRFGPLPHKLRVLRLQPRPAVSTPIPLRAHAIGLRKQKDAERYRHRSGIEVRTQEGHSARLLAPGPRYPLYSSSLYHSCRIGLAPMLGTTQIAASPIGAR